VGEALGIIHIGMHFLSTYGPVKLENKLSAPKIQQWDKHRMTIIDIPVQK
jgi:hypothetical protein